MEKTVKGRGDFADDVHPERSIDLGHQHQLSLAAIGSSSITHTQNDGQWRVFAVPYNSAYSAAVLEGNVSNFVSNSARDNIGSELQLEMMPNGFKTNSLCGYFYQNHNQNQQNGVNNKQGQVNSSVHNSQSVEEQQTNVSIAEEEKQQISSECQFTASFASANFRLELKPEKHIHSMTEKKQNNFFEQKRRALDPDALEQMDPDCMSECQPQLIPKFTYCVSMPQNLPREQSYEALKKANQTKFTMLQNASYKLNQLSPVVINYKKFLDTSYQLARERPEECAHLLLTLETQLDLILHVNKPLPKEYVKFQPNEKQKEQGNK